MTKALFHLSHHLSKQLLDCQTLMYELESDEPVRDLRIQLHQRFS
jgi:hypothetical protein